MVLVMIQPAVTRLNDRDRQIAQTVGMLRQVTATQIQRLYFDEGSIGTRARRQARVLARLAEWGEIRRVPRFRGGSSGGSTPFVYIPSSNRSRAADEHLLSIAELYVCLVEAERAGHLELLEFSPEPYAKAKEDRLSLRPDAYARIASAGRRRRYFLEVDRTSEWQAQLVSKMQRYALAYDSWQERTFPLVLFIVPDEARARSIEMMAKRQRHPELFAVCVFDQAVTALVES
jgi:hypothetical protein